MNKSIIKKKEVKGTFVLTPDGKKKLFECPWCRSNFLDIKYSQVFNLGFISTTGEIFTGNDTLNREIEEVFCSGCEKVIENDCGETITDKEELHKWILEHCK